MAHISQYAQRAQASTRFQLIQNLVIPAVQLLLVLLPLAALVMLGPSDSAAMLIGGSIALAFTWRSIPWRNLPQQGIVIVGISVYAALAWVNEDYVVNYYWHYAILSLFYALPTGWFIRRLISTGKSEAVVLAFTIFSLLLTVAAMRAIEAAGVESLIGVANSEISRMNRIGDQAYYWRYFYISNVIVGIIPYTFFALCGAPMLFVHGRMVTKGLTMLALSLGIYVNFIVVTRTALLAGAISFFLVMFGLWHSRIRVNKWAVLLGMLGITSLSIYFIIKLKFESLSLFERFSRSGEDMRFVIWKESLHLIITNPLGGGIDQLRSALWGHNLLLDAGLSTGVLGLLCITAMICSVTFQVIRLAFHGLLFNDTANTYIVCIFIGAIAVSMVMPPQLPVIVVILITSTALLRDRETSKRDLRLRELGGLQERERSLVVKDRRTS